MDKRFTLDHHDRGTMSRGEYAYRILREAIHGGNMKPGQRVREVEIAELLGISRTPAREAIRKLEAEGMLTAASRGFVVTKLEYTQVLELYSMREVLEGTAARFAAQHASEMEIQALCCLLEKQESQAENAGALAETNRQFHKTIHNAAHNRYLLSALNALTDALALLEGTTFSVAGRAATSSAEHHHIIDAIARRDPNAAERTAREHIREGARLRVHMIAEAQRGQRT